MSGSVSTERSPSLPTPPTDTSADPLDTALPPMSSKQLVPVRPSESSMVLNNFRNSQRVSAAFYSQDAMPMVTHGSAAHRRTGSTIKTVMRKIFTRKRRSNTDDFESVGPGPRPGGYRYSNPTERIGHSLPRSVNVRRGSPLKEESETPQPDDFYHLQARPPRRRRATLPSLAFSDEEARAALNALASEPSPYRPNSSLAPPGAPARDHRRDLLRTRRRSRSADALRAVAADHRMDPIQWRRRRSVASVEYVGTTVSDSELSYRPPTGTTLASAPEESTAPSVYDTDDSQLPADAHDDDDDDNDDEDDNNTNDNNNNNNRNSILVPNAGTLISAMQHDPDLSVDQRLATIEVKLIDLEFAIARMQTSPTPSSTTRARSTPRSRHAHSRKPSVSKHAAPGTSSGPPPLHPATAASLPPLPPQDRPLSTATIKPSTSDSRHPRAPTHRAPSTTTTTTSPLPSPQGISIEQYSALVLLLRREQNARRTLESELSTLRQDVHQLQLHQGVPTARGSLPSSTTTTTTSTATPGTMYPIHSAESSEFLRLRERALRSQSISPARTEQRFSSSSPRDSGAEWDKLPYKRWHSARHVDTGGLI